MEKPKKILIVCGEPSGDIHAANLVKSLKEIYPRLEFCGLGGSQLKSQAVKLYFNPTSIAVVGFFEVLKNLGLFKKIFTELLKKVDLDKPDLAILVDYPGFNLRLAEQLHKRNIPVIYYISPQIWAWGAKRIKIIKKTVSKMLVFFPFEEKLYQQHGVDAAYVGHPLVEMTKPAANKDELFRTFKIDSAKITISLLPGSREKEIKTLLPVMLECAKIINAYFYGRVQFLILRTPAVSESTFKKIISPYKLPLYLVSDMTHNGLAVSDFALVCSGTATLETAVIGCPMAILYKVSLLTWVFIRSLIKIPYIGLVNVVAGKKITEEFLQFDCRPEKICDYVIPLLQSKDSLKRLKPGLLAVKEALGSPGASLRAAEIVADFLKKTS